MNYVLVKLPNWLGDAVMLTPTISLLHTIYPQAKLVLVGNALSTSIFTTNDFIIKIFIDKSKEQRGFFKRLKATKKLAYDINLYLKEQNILQFDYAITTQNNFFSAFLLSKIFTRYSVGYGDKHFLGLRQFLLSNIIKFSSSRSPVCKHQVLSYVNLLLAVLPPDFFKKILESTTIDSIKKHPNYNPNASLVQNVLFTQTPELMLFTQITTKKPFDKKIVAISPGASYGISKMWLPQYFTEIIISFVKKGYSVRIYGAKSELKHNNTIYENAVKMLPLESPIENLSGKTNLQELINSLYECSLYIGNDSGTTHIAKALKIPSVIIFGSMPFAWCSPWSICTIKKQEEYYYIDNTIAVQKHLPCVPCKKKICPLQHHNCMKLITPDEILNLALSLQ
ncbi:hypothetical protein CQA53_02770 [Helicobacter didelphidarum]|uniref:Lipopolysaccharide heptosyltransferase II n=1 Tax=Helicobacter didelphidarum TaxID=2040648 RepID=A0A3D8IQ22_9HELI|nr:glycosyltransferase family 9 protein [Helicobacter didelphidarum]RDU66711.1 hypothetical protein CQA53_02770 [Helicobacter didelphidarum]